MKTRSYLLIRVVPTRDQLEGQLATLRAAAQAVVETWSKAGDERRSCEYCDEPATHAWPVSGGTNFACDHCAKGDLGEWEHLSSIHNDAIAALAVALKEVE